MRSGLPGLWLVAFACSCSAPRPGVTEDADITDDGSADGNSITDGGSTDTGPSQRLLVAILGQSNGEGRGDPANLTDMSLADPLPGVAYAANNAPGATTPAPSFSMYTGPLAPFDYDGGLHHGLELTLARDLHPAMVVKYAIGGTSLGYDWLVDGRYPAGENLAHSALDAVASAQAACGCERVVIIWEQGERDALAPSYAAVYQANLEALVALSRAQFPDVLWVVGRLNAGIAPAYTSTPQIRAAQEAFVAGDAHAVLVDQDPVPLGPDLVHYTADGYAQLGHMFAAAIASD